MQGKDDSIFAYSRCASGKEKRIASLPELLPQSGNAVTAMW
jgi:hypothetical protein